MVWNTKSLKGMPFRVQTHQIYFSREKFLSDKNATAWLGGADPTRHPRHAAIHPLHKDAQKDHEANRPSLTQVGALDDPEVALAAEGAGGEIGGGVHRGGAFFLVPHHGHHSAAVQAVHGKVPEDLLLKGQGRARGEQWERAQPQQEGAMWQHPWLIFVTEDTQQNFIFDKNEMHSQIKTDQNTSICITCVHFILCSTGFIMSEIHCSFNLLFLFGAI